MASFTKKPESDDNFSLTLSLTPPKDEADTISEHLSSIENDRSLQEIEMTNFQNVLNLSNLSFESQRAPEDVKSSSMNSVGVDYESKNNARSILDEILGDDQFKSREPSLDLFANLNLDNYNFANDNPNEGPCDFEDPLTKNNNVQDSFRELLSGPSTNGTSTTDYKQFQEECHQKLIEYHDALVHRDEQIDKLSVALQQIILSREEEKRHFDDEMGRLQEQLEKTSNLLIKNDCTQNIGSSPDESRTKLEQTLDSAQLSLLGEFKLALTEEFVKEKRRLEDEIVHLKAELSRRLRDVDEASDSRRELDARHSREMEELRTYFEKKCTDLEKNYSEEIFSLQSRKLSGSSSSCSDGEMSDFVFTQPGPGGDTKTTSYTKKDVVKLRRNLAEMIELIDGYDLNELTDADFDKLECAIGQFELNHLVKYDLNRFRSELQNKYHAELEILREDFENRGDTLRVEHEKKMRDMEKHYLEEIDDLNVQLRGRITTTTTQQETGNSDEFEIDEVVQSYERRLQEQVGLAKLDIIAALESQIQRLVSSEDVDADWPEELLRLKSRFAEHYQKKLSESNERHEAEMARIKAEHDRALEKTPKDESTLLRERDAFKKRTSALKHLLGALMKYFTRREDELNNTLVEEIVDGDGAKRVHMLPNFDDLYNLIDSNSPENELNSFELQTELEKLKTDADAILALTTNLYVEDDGTTKNELDEARGVICSLENQLVEMLQRQKILDAQLMAAREKISTLSEHKEIVSEGYGEDGDCDLGGGLAEVEASLRGLQEKIRGLSENPTRLNVTVMGLVEDLSRVGDKIVEEAKRDRDDLKQQVEQLERQLRDMSKALNASEEHRNQVENECKEAVDKIFELRDIIRDLEEQLKTKTSSEKRLSTIVDELEAIVRVQIEEEAQEKADVSVIDKFQKYVASLEGEIQRLTLNAELAGGEGTIRQIKNHLCDIETTLDKRTKDLEGLHWSATTCSSPSEDMSIRDVVHQERRDVFDECEVPLQQLARLKDKLVRHSRAEDAAMKRIGDLEMQVNSLKSELEESHVEREILSKQMSDHLVLISNLQIRLDEQRIRAEHIEKQTNTSLEVQNYDLKTTIARLEDEIVKREKTIGQLKCAVEETKKRLEDREREICEQNKVEADLVVRMQEEVEFLVAENLKLKTKVDKQLDDQVVDASTDFDNFERGRRANVTEDSQISPIISRTKGHDRTVFREVSTPHFFSSLPYHREDSSEKHVRFEDQVRDDKLSDLERIIDEKNKAIDEYERRRIELEDTIEKLRSDLGAAVADLNKTKKESREERKRSDERIKAVTMELEECHKRLDETSKLVLEKEEDLKMTQKLLADVNRNMLSKVDELECHERTLKIQDDEVKKLRDEVDALRKHGEAVAYVTDENVDLRKQLDAARKESLHFEHLVMEKDRVIDQMSADSRSLHVNLETIQNKLRENGNVVDLSRRLCEEQKKNFDLQRELHAAKAQLLGGDVPTEDLVAVQVRKELDYSAQLDATLIDAVSDNDASKGTEAEALRMALKRQISITEQMEAAKEAAEKRLDDLEGKHETLKKQLSAVQYEDAVLIAQMRTKLDDALRNEHEFDKILRAELRTTNSSSLPNASSDYVGLREMIAKLEDENCESRRQIEQLRAARSREIHELESRVTELICDEQKLKEETIKLRQMLESKENELAAIRKSRIPTNSEEETCRDQDQKTKRSSADPVPEQILNNIRELNEAVAENAYMVDLITRLNCEKVTLERQIFDLEAPGGNLPFTGDAVSRANYLFAKYLRSESYRKQLAWQKQYLVSLLESYQNSSRGSSILTDVGFNTVEWKRTKRNARKTFRFKHVAIAVVAICRMKYLVRRWHSGKRIVSQKSKNDPKFQIGQPVSSQNFASPVHRESKTTSNRPKTDMPWFGTSPPSREPKVFKFESNTPSTHQRIKGNLSSSSLRDKNRLPDVLTSPAMLSKYIERFNEIQNKFGLDGSQ